MLLHTRYRVSITIKWRLILYKGMFSVYSRDLKEIINVFCGNNGKLLNRNASGRDTGIQWAVKGKHNEIRLQKEQCITAMFQTVWRVLPKKLLEPSFLRHLTPLWRNRSRLLGPDETPATTCTTAKCHIK